MSLLLVWGLFCLLCFFSSFHWWSRKYPQAGFKVRVHMAGNTLSSLHNFFILVALPATRFQDARVLGLSSVYMAIDTTIIIICLCKSLTVFSQKKEVGYLVHHGATLLLYWLALWSTVCQARMSWALLYLWFMEIPLPLGYLAYHRSLVARSGTTGKTITVAEDTVRVWSYAFCRGFAANALIFSYVRAVLDNDPILRAPRPFPVIDYLLGRLVVPSVHAEPCKSPSEESFLLWAVPLSILSLLNILFCSSLLVKWVNGVLAKTPHGTGLKLLIPWAIVLSRVAQGVMLACYPEYFPDGWRVVAMIVVAVVGDIADGILARQFGTDSPAIRVADSFADDFFIYVGCLWHIAHSPLNGWLLQSEGGWLLWVKLYGATFIAWVVVDFLKWRRWCGYHQQMSRVHSLFGGVVGCMIHIFGSRGHGGLVGWAFGAWMIIGVVRNIEALAITAVLRHDRKDVPFLWHAFRSHTHSE